MKIYISGPISGKTDHNAPLFRAVRLALEGQRFDDATTIAVDPHDLVPSNATHQDGMRLCLNELTMGDFDAIVMLPGWEDSKGARLEASVAQAIGLKLFKLS